MAAVPRAAGEAVASTAATRPLRRPERTSRAPQSATTIARQELIGGQVVNGIMLTVEACLVLQCRFTLVSAPLGLAVGLALGGTAGGALAFALSTDGVTPGAAHAVTLGTMWGLWHGVTLGFATGAFESADYAAGSVALGMGVGQLSGLALGAALNAALLPTASQVLLTTSGGIWMTVLAGLAFAMTDAEPNDAPLGLTLLVASDVGLATGAILAGLKPIRTARVLLIDAGGLLGMFVGMIVAINAGGPEVDGRWMSPSLAVGAVTGLATAAAITAGMDEGDADGDPLVALFLVPAPGGALGSMRVAF